jgi:hypothetical protein
MCSQPGDVTVGDMEGPYTLHGRVALGEHIHDSGVVSRDVFTARTLLVRAVDRIIAVWVASVMRSPTRTGNSWRSTTTSWRGLTRRR